MVILPAKFSRVDWILESKLNGLLVSELVSRLYPNKTNKQKDTINHVQSSTNMVQSWYAMRVAICVAYARFGKE